MKLGTTISTAILVMIPAIANAAATAEISSRNDVSMEWKNSEAIGARPLDYYPHLFNFECRSNLELTIAGESHMYSQRYGAQKNLNGVPPTESEVIDTCNKAFSGRTYEEFITKVQTLGRTQVEFTKTSRGFPIKTCYVESMLLFLDIEGNVDTDMGNAGWKTLRRVVACP